MRERIPIYLGAIGPTAIEQAAEIADGLDAVHVHARPPPPELLRPFDGRDVEDRAGVMACVERRLSSAPAPPRPPRLAVYLGGMGRAARRSASGRALRPGRMAREVQRLFLAGDRAGAAAALSPELIDATAICCRPGELGERLAARALQAGADTLVVPYGDRKG